MNKKIRLKENYDVSYSIKKSERARRMRLAVYCDGRVVITMPRGMIESTVEKFLIEKADWLLNKINLFSQAKDFSVPKLSKGDYYKNKEKAFLLISERAEYFNKIYDFKYNKIFVKNQKTRWGSCSRRCNLNFNYKILFLPDDLRDYIIVHELCHLKEFNHSRKFWDLVAQIFPNFREIRKKLKTIGLSVR
ncbi:M48 family metallopeptidase [Candidatus Parcubacteria bacterium]|nr:M48 family metallopeptidase [Candidatus Parcubacteria bacterium]